MTKVMDICDYISLLHYDVSIHLDGCKEAKSHVGEPHLIRNCRQPPEDNKTVTTNKTHKTPEALRLTSARNIILPTAMQAGKWILAYPRHMSENPALGSTLTTP